MKFQIKTLIENTTRNTDFACEHGLSLYVSDGEHHILFDTGATPQFMKNAEKMGVSLNNLDALVLSHGHFDHTGGAEALLEKYAIPHVYTGKNFFDRRYSDSKTPRLDISSRLDQQALLKSGADYHIVTQPITSLFPGIYIVSGFANTNELEPPAPFLLRECGMRKEVDLFEDEIALVLETEEELALVSGCSHTGILSMCDHVRILFGRPVTVFIGGTHLMEADDRRIVRTCNALKKNGIHRLGACHCNGEAAGAYFKKNFPGFFLNHVGDVVEL